MSWRRAGKFLALTTLAVLIALSLAYRDVFSLEEARVWFASLGPWAAVVFVLTYSIGTLLFAPGSVLTMTSGAIFGPLLGTILSLIGATVGATLAFIVARFLGREWVSARLDGRQLGEIVRGIEEGGWRFVAFVRLVPLFPFNVVNYTLGLTGIRLREYVVASAVCMIPGAAAFAFLGHSGREAISGSSDSSVAIQAGLTGLAILAAVTFLLPRLARRLRKDKGSP